MCRASSGARTAFTMLAFAWAVFAADVPECFRGAPAGALAAEVGLEEPYCFTDGAAVLVFEAGPAAVSYNVRTITPAGWGPSASATDGVADGRLRITPLVEGIHIVTVERPVRAEVRFLAIDPPPAADEDAVLENLPRRGWKLLAGEEYTILAMGDSVANTGDYETMLVMMLARATGNGRIRFLDRSYPGRSVDAAVRFFEDDAIPNRPDLGLLMYGLNDQACFVPLDGYLEQYAFIAERMAGDLGADTVFMQPTPHIEVPVGPVEKGKDVNPPHFAFRTIGFAESLRPLAAGLGVPLAETFRAIWGGGGDTIQDSVRAMWPLYPPGYSDQMRSMIETDGRGDTIHPNALGHLAMANAVFDAITGRKDEPPLSFEGVSEWRDGGVVSRVAVRNASAARRRGRLEAHPFLEDELASAGPIRYDLAPGESLTFEVSRPKASRPEDLLVHPADIYVAPGRPLVPVVDFCGGRSRVHAVAAPFALTARFLRERSVCERRHAHAWLETDSELRARIVAIPEGSAVGRVPLVEEVTANGTTGWAVAELAYVRYGSALAGEAKTDGSLGEWEGHVWSPVGERCQARFARGPEDNRTRPDDCYLTWAFKAGRKGMHFAVKGRGSLGRDRFVVFFDARAPEFLGTAGRYYWAGGALGPEGRVRLDKGETTRSAPGLAGRWKSAGDAATIEMFVPYELMEIGCWPASGDLGLSIWWMHSGADGKTTNLMWSENGHPWNTRWYGVVRLQERADAAALPYAVRVK
jgi:lysophospholipase L1-like esterase